VQLLDSRSSEVRRALRSSGGLYVSNPSAEFHITVVGNTVLVGICIIAAVSRQWKLLEVLALSLTVWNVVLLWRARVTRTHWLLLGVGNVLYLRLFVPRKIGRYPPPEADVMKLELDELARLSVRAIDITWSQQRRETVRWLGVEFKPQTAPVVAAMFQRFGDGGTGCDPSRNWLAANQGSTLVMKWQKWRPPLADFIQQVSRIYPDVLIGEEPASALSLIRFTSKSDDEQIALLRQLKRLGFGYDCVLVLKRYKRMSIAKAAEFMANIT